MNTTEKNGCHNEQKIKLPRAIYKRINRSLWEQQTTFAICLQIWTSFVILLRVDSGSKEIKKSSKKQFTYLVTCEEPHMNHMWLSQIPLKSHVILPHLIHKWNWNNHM